MYYSLKDRPVAPANQLPATACGLPARLLLLLCTAFESDWLIGCDHPSSPSNLRRLSSRMYTLVLLMYVVQTLQGKEADCSGCDALMPKN